MKWKEMPIVAGNVYCPTGPGGGVDPTCSPTGDGGVGDIKSMDDAKLNRVFGITRLEEPQEEIGIQSDEFRGDDRLAAMEKRREIEKEAGLSRWASDVVILPTMFQPFNSSYAGTGVSASIERVLGVQRSAFDLQREKENKVRAKDHGKRAINQDMKINKFSFHYRADNDIVDKIVDTTYKKTQSVLQKEGVSKLQLYRGSSQLSGGESNVVESWTADRKIAEKFAKAVGGEVQSQTIPADRIFATPATGWGVGSQVEVLVLKSKPSTIKANASKKSNSLEILKWEWWLKGNEYSSSMMVEANEQ